MAETRLADIIVPEIMTDMVTAQISNYMDFVRAGIAVKDYKNVQISDGGDFARVPFYKQLLGDDEVLTDDTSLVPQKITTGVDIGVVCHRGKAWGSRDLAAITSGSDPQKEIAKQVAAFWGKKSATHLISVLNGLFDGTSGVLKDTHRYVYGETGGTKTMVHSAVVTAAQKLGDAMDGFDAIVMHSKQYADALNAKMVTFPTEYDPGNTNLKVNGKYMGLEIIVSDYCPTYTATVLHYTAYLCKKGSLYYGMQKNIMTESDRDILAFKDVLSTSMHFVPHVKLCKWNVTTTNPTNTALGTATNWLKVADDDKFIGVVALITN